MINDITLSIVIPTIGRKRELSELLDSIINLKTNVSFEVIIVDQNNSGYLNDVLLSYNSKIPIQHFNVNFRGLSKAKNFGVEISNGKYVCFPDDDAKFMPDTIDKAMDLLYSYKVDIVFGKCVDSFGFDSVIKFKTKKMFLNLKNFEGAFVEATMFSNISVFKKYKFDEKLGAGTFNGAEEGFDFVLNQLKIGTAMCYSPDIIFIHPQTVPNKIDVLFLKRVFTYRCGFARMTFKNRLYFKYIKRLVIVLISIPVFLVLFRFQYVKKSIVEFCALVVGTIIE